MSKEFSFHKEAVILANKVEDDWVIDKYAEEAKTTDPKVKEALSKEIDEEIKRLAYAAYLECLRENGLDYGT